MDKEKKEKKASNNKFKIRREEQKKGGKTVFLNNIYFLILIPILIFLINESFLNVFSENSEIFKGLVNMILNILQLLLPILGIILYSKSKKIGAKENNVTEAVESLTVTQKFLKLFNAGLFIAGIIIVSNVIIQAVLGVRYFSVLSVISLVTILGIITSTIIFIYELTKKIFKEILLAPVFSIICIYSINYLSQYLIFKKIGETSILGTNSGMYLAFNGVLNIPLLVISIIYTILIVLVAKNLNKNNDENVKKSNLKIKNNNGIFKDILNIFIGIILIAILLLSFNLKEKLNLNIKGFNSNIDIDMKVLNPYKVSKKLEKSIKENKKKIVLTYSGKKYEQLIIEKIKNINEVNKIINPKEDKKIEFKILASENEKQLVENEKEAEVLLVEEKNQNTESNYYLIDLKAEGRIIWNDEKVYSRLDDEIAEGINAVNLDKSKRTLGVLTNKNSFKQNIIYEKINLESKGIYIKKVDSKNKKEIKSVKNLIIPTFTKDLSDEETNNVLEFIKNGGNIICIKMFKNGGEQKPNLNKILSMYAVKIDDKSMLLEQDDNYRYKNIKELSEKERKENSNKQKEKKAGEIKKFAEEVYNNAIIYPEVTLANDVGKIVNAINPIKPIMIPLNSVIELNYEQVKQQNIEFKELLKPSNRARKVEDPRKEDIETKVINKGTEGNYVLAALATKNLENGKSKLLVFSSELIWEIAEANPTASPIQSIAGKEFIVGNIKELIYDNHKIELVDQKQKVRGEQTQRKINNIKTVESSLLVIVGLIYLIVYAIKNKKSNKKA